MYIHSTFPAWAWVGYGQSSSLARGQESTAGQKRIIVSRSHAGEVYNVAKETLGDVNITPAGGAGMCPWF